MVSWPKEKKKKKKLFASNSILFLIHETCLFHSKPRRFSAAFEHHILMKGVNVSPNPSVMVRNPKQPTAFQYLKGGAIRQKGTVSSAGFAVTGQGEMISI